MLGTPGPSLQSPTPKPLGHKGIWTTQTLTLGWFVTLLPLFQIRGPWLGSLSTKKRITGAWHPRPSCRLPHRVLIYSWRSATLTLRKKLTSPTARLEWCHVHFSHDSYSTFIRRVIWQGGRNKARTPLYYLWAQNSTLNPHEIVTRLPLTISFRFVSYLPGIRRNLPMFGQCILERIGLLTTGTGILG